MQLAAPLRGAGTVNIGFIPSSSGFYVVKPPLFTTVGQLLKSKRPDLCLAFLSQYSAVCGAAKAVGSDACERHKDKGPFFADDECSEIVLSLAQFKHWSVSVAEFDSLLSSVLDALMGMGVISAVSTASSTAVSVAPIGPSSIPAPSPIGPKAKYGSDPPPTSLPASAVLTSAPIAPVPSLEALAGSHGRTAGHVMQGVGDLYFKWGEGDPASGLSAFAGDPSLLLYPDERMARTWQKVLLEGEVGKAPLTGLAPTYICQSRRGALKEIAPRLTWLDSGTLRSQRKCFAVLGPRGAGKTHFTRSLVALVARVARPSTCAIYLSAKSQGLQEPLKLLQDALKDPSSGVTLPPELRGPEASMHCLLHFMRANGRRALLVMDGIEVLFSAYDKRSCRVHQQLYSIGEFDADEQPVMVVLTGSNPVLPALLFSLSGWTGIEKQYKAHHRFGGLCDWKFTPITLRPMVAADDVRRAILCLSSGIPDRARGLQLEGHLVAPPLCGASSELGIDNVLAEGYSVSEDFLQWVCSRCRGVACWIEDVLDNPSLPTTPLQHIFQFPGPGSQQEACLRRLLDAWVQHARSQSKDVAVAAADIYDAKLCVFGLHLGPRESARPWIELMDKGLVFFDDFSVYFLHPSDVGTLLLHFRSAGEGPCLDSKDESASDGAASSAAAEMIPSTR